jgi:hypothetical protein
LSTFAGYIYAVQDCFKRFFLFILDNPGHLPAAPGAFAPEYQHARIDFAAGIADCSHIAASNTPYRVENFELNISGYRPPDIFRLGGKIVIRFK